MNSPDDILASLLTLLEKELQKFTIDLWFSDAKAVALRQDCFIIRTSPYKKEVILARFRDVCRKVLFQIFSTEMDLVVLTDGDELPEPAPAVSAPEAMEYTFENFIVGNSNKFAHAAAYAVAMNPANSYNPLFIYGGSGLGKTHLMKAISETIRSSHPDYHILYMTSEDFTNELIEALKYKSTEEFRSKYRAVDVLLVDDIQFLAGKVQTQEEFFHTFNTLYESGRQIVLTSDRPPKEMLRLEDRLKSRFESGLLADIQPPDYETRVAIVRTKAARLGIPLSQEAIAYISENIKANIRQIEGILKKIQAYIDLQGVDVVTMELVQQITKEIIDAEKAYAPELIIDKIADFYNISPEEISGKGKTRNVANARQMAIYLIRKLTSQTLEDIGKLIGRDHSTVLYSIRKMEESLASDPKLADTVRAVTANITNK